MIVNQKVLIHLRPLVNHKPIRNKNDCCTPSAVSLIAKVMLFTTLCYACQNFDEICFKRMIRAMVDVWKLCNNICIF